MKPFDGKYFVTVNRKRRVKGMKEAAEGGVPGRRVNILIAVAVGMVCFLGNMNVVDASVDVPWTEPVSVGTCNGIEFYLSWKHSGQTEVKLVAINTNEHQYRYEVKLKVFSNHGNAFKRILGTGNQRGNTASKPWVLTAFHSDDEIPVKWGIVEAWTKDNDDTSLAGTLSSSEGKKWCRDFALMATGAASNPYVISKKWNVTCVENAEKDSVVTYDAEITIKNGVVEVIETEFNDDVKALTDHIIIRVEDITEVKMNDPYLSIRTTTDKLSCSEYQFARDRTTGCFTPDRDENPSYHAEFGDHRSFCGGAAINEIYGILKDVVH
jgi:hypothetical protein